MVNLDIFGNKLINRYGQVKVILKNKPKTFNPFQGIDVLIQIG